MLTRNPVLLLCSFIGGLLSVFVTNKKTDLGLYIVIFLVISLTNPIFSHNGETVLFFLFEQRITLEALIYGIGAGVLIVAVIYWFKLFGSVFTEDKLAWLIGKITPKLCVVFCMALRFIPLFKENARSIYNAQLSMGIFDTDSIKGKLHLAMNVFSALISLSIENAVETADTMHSRGYGSGKRSSYSLLMFSKRDILFSVVTLMLDACIIRLLIMGEGVFYYYPSIRFGTFTPWSIVLYVLFAFLCIMPAINQLVEGLKWKYLISRI